MPGAWKPVRIQPIYKKGSPLDPNNYRPIAITSVLYRLYASMLTTVTDSWAREHGHVRDEQFGFQRQRSTTQAAFVLRHLAHAQRAASYRGRLHCAFVDFEKAYDSVNHGLLWSHLRDSLQMPTGLLMAVQAMYEGAVYVLQDGQKRTRQVPASRGIKQGCPLSPLLFSLFINDLPAFLQQHCPAEGIKCGERKVRCVKFADDLSLLSDSSGGLQLLLDALHHYSVGKQITVNVKKTEVLVFGGRLTARKASQQITYGPEKQLLKMVSGFKFLGLQLTESGSMEQTMEARSAPFTAALHQSSRMAARVRLGRHIPTRLRLAEIYATPVANYGDVVWSTALLQPKHSMQNQLQRQLLSHMQVVAGVPASTPRWPLLNELGLQPMQRGWWSHVIRFYNAAVSVAGRESSPLMTAAMAADVALTKSQGGASRDTWSGQLLSAINAVEAASAGTNRSAAQSSSMSAAVEELRPLPEAALLQLIDQAYQQQWGDEERRGDPRDPATQHRPEATYNKWFRQTAGTILAHAATRTRSKDCAQVRDSLRLRLGALGVEVTTGRRNHLIPFETRLCRTCKEAGAGDFVEDVQHTCFECPHMRGKIAGKGWEDPPRGARDFQQLYAKENIRGAMRYVEKITECVNER